MVQVTTQEIAVEPSVGVKETLVPSQPPPTPPVAITSITLPDVSVVTAETSVVADGAALIPMVVQALAPGKEPPFSCANSAIASLTGSAYDATLASLARIV